MKRRMVILGGGLAGLSAAFELSKNPQNNVVVLEKEKEAGGLARTINYKNFLFEFGPHRFYTKNTFIENLVKDLLGDELLVVNRQTRIFFDGKFFDYPPTFSDTIKLGYGQAAKIFLDYLWVRIKSLLRKPKIRTLKDAYIDQFGKSLYQLFFEDFSEKLWGLPTSQISADWAIQRTKKMSITKILKEMIFKKREVVSLVDKFYFPKKGIGRISERLAEEIIKKGGEILTQADVLEININGKKIESVEFKLKGERKTIKGDFFISSLPINLFIKMLLPAPPPKILSTTERLRFRDLVLVNLIINQRNFSQDHWLYTQGKGICNRIIQPKNFSKGLVPDKRKTSLSAEYTIWENEKISDKELIEKTIKTITETLGFIKKEKILDAFVLRAHQTYPLYDLGYKKNLTFLEEYLTGFNNLQTIGRAGLFRYNNMDHSILSGIYAARNIEGADYDLDKINLDQEYLEEKREK